MEINVATEIVELPSKGLLYPESNPLSSGKVEIKYMTAAEEDILTNQNYIKNGTVLDHLVKSVLVSKVNMDDLIVGDKDAILIATRVLGYGKDYTFNHAGDEYTVDLSEADNKPIDETLFKKGTNEFEFKLPNTDNTVTFKILTHADEKKIQQEIEGLKKIQMSADVSTRLKYIITSVNGNRETKTIREFVDKGLIARDSRALREYINKIQPGVNLTFFPQGRDKAIPVPLKLSFFWPDAE